MSRNRATLGTTGVFAPPPAAAPKPGRKANPTKAEATTARPDREGKVALPFWTTAPAKRQLRLLAAEEDTTQQLLMAEALNLLTGASRR
jgi:hypothetical protein